MTRVVKKLVTCFSVLFIVSAMGGCSHHLSHQYIETNGNDVVVVLKKSYKHGEVDYSILADISEPLVFSEDTYTLTGMTANSVISISDDSRHESLLIKQVLDETQYIHTAQGQERAAAPHIIKRYMDGVFTNTALLAEARVTALVRYQTIDSAIAQAQLASNDETAAAYLKSVSQLKQLSPRQITQVIKLISNIHSDYKQRRTASYFVSEQGITSQSHWLLLLDGLSSLGSDYEARRVLEKLAPALPIDPMVHAAFFKVSASIGSDYEKYQLLSTLSHGDNSLNMRDIIDASLDIGSDYEAYRLVSDIASKVTTKDGFAPLIKLISTIGSDYEMQRAITALPLSQISPTSLISLIDLAADSIGSDYELTKVITHIQAQCITDEPVIRVLNSAIKSVSSASERAKVDGRLSLYCK